MTRAIFRIFFSIALLVCQGFPVYAAEIRGQVRLAGMPGKLPTGIDSTVVVVLLPASSTERITSKVSKLTISNGRTDKSLLVLQPGDRLAIVNRDPVLQPLLLFGRRGSREVRLGKHKRRGTAAIRYVRFSKPGSWYLVGRLDNRIFTRIVVVKLHSKIRTRPGKMVDFRNLQAGTWKLRIYSLLAADKTYTAEAYTSPQVNSWKISPDRALVPATPGVPGVNVHDLYRARTTR